MADDLSGRTLGDFVLLEKLNEGGCGTLYRCSQPLLEREAVIKVLREPQHGDKESDDRPLREARFLREAQLASRLDHHFAAHIYAYAVEKADGLRWIAMELVRGETLDEWLRKRGPMPFDRFVQLFECIAEVVHHAHALGIVHRDLKASNVMVIERDGKLIPKLLDFGIAKMSQVATSTSGVVPNTPDGGTHDLPGGAAVSDEATNTDPELKDRLTPLRGGMGSWAYMSPEQWDDAHAVTAASDIYALGVLAYKALTGRPPFPGPDKHQWREQHLRADVPPLGGDLPKALDRILQRTLAKNPEDRPSSAPALASELRTVLMACERELLRSLALQWDACARPPALLLSGNVLAGVERWTRRAPTGVLSSLECSYVAASHRRARRMKRVWKALIALPVALAVLGGCAFVLYRAALEKRTAEDLVTQAHVERGQQALIHGESNEAVIHLEEAYQRGDHSPGVRFMLARGLQPRMSEIARFTSSSGRMWSAMFAPDGKRALTTDDKSARMWDAESGQLLFTMSHGDIVYQAVFSPDGARIITAGGDGTVRIWNAATGAPMRELTWSGETQLRYYAVAVSSHFVAAIDLMGRVAHIWNADGGTQVAELKNDAGELGQLAFSADGHWLATSGGDDVRVFDVSTWRQAVTIAGPLVRSLSFDPTSQRLAVGTFDGNASIWEIPSGVRVRCLREAGESVDAVAFSRDGALLATGSREGAEQVWDSRSGGLRTQFNSHHSKIYAIEFASTGNLMLSAGGDGSVVVSNVGTGIPVARLDGPKGLVIAAHFDLSARRVVGASWDGTARVWDASSPYLRWGSSPIGTDCDVMDSLEPDQRFIALSCRHGTRIWDTHRGELLAELPAVTPVEGDYYSAFPAVSSAGDRSAIAHGKTVEIYALPSGQLLRTIIHPAPVNAVAFAPAGHDLVSGAVDGSLLLTRDDRDPIALPASATGIDAAAILADGRVVVADASARLRVFDPDRNVPLMNLAAPSRVRLLRPSPDGTRLVTVSIRSKQAPPALWDLSRRRLIAQLDGHVGRVFAARFVATAGGQAILTAGADGTARLWNAATGSSRQSFHGDSHFLVDAALSPDGLVVIAGGSDGLLRFWDVSSGRLMWTLQAHKSYVVGVHFDGAEIVTRGFAGDISRWTLPQSDSVIEACHASTCASATLPGKIVP